MAGPESEQNYKAFEEDDYFQDNTKSQSKKRMSGGVQYELTAKILITLTFVLTLLAPMFNELSYFKYAGPDFSIYPVIPVQCDGVCGFFNYRYCDDRKGSEYGCTTYEYVMDGITTGNVVTSCNRNGITNFIKSKWDGNVDPTKQVTANVFVFLFIFIAIIILLIVTLFAWIPFKCCDCIKRLLFVFIIIAGILKVIALIAFVAGSTKGSKALCLNDTYTENFVAGGLADEIAWKIGATTILIIISTVLSFVSAFFAKRYLVKEDKNRKDSDEDEMINIDIIYQNKIVF